MGDRLKRLLDKASAQVKRSGNSKNIQISVSDVDKRSNSVVDDLANTNEFPVQIIADKTNQTVKKSKQKSPVNENDEIKAYLNQLSRKTRPDEVDKNENEKSQSEISDISSLLMTHEEINNPKKVSKYSTDQDNDSIYEIKPQTALERLSHFEKKYSKSQAQKSKLLESESDISFSDSIKIQQSLKIDDNQTADLIDEIEERKNQSVSEDDISSFKIEDLHLIDELPELINEDDVKSIENSEKSVEKTEKSVEKSGKSVEKSGKSVEKSGKSVEISFNYSEEEIESEISIIETSDETNPEFNSQHQLTPTKSSSSTQTDISAEIEDKIESESDENLLQNVHFDTLSESQLNSTKNQQIPSISQPSTSTTSLKQRQIKNSTISNKLKSQKSVAIQTNLYQNPNLNIKPLFGAELDPNISSLTLTNLLIKQGTLDALTVTNPAIVALNEMIKEQINFTNTVFMSRHHLYTQQMSSLQPDYHYTTWNDTIKDVARYKKMKMKKRRSRVSTSS